MLMREAAELRRQSEKEGVLAYLQKPNVRSRPNSRFLTATVRGVQQANRAVEVNEMWRAREKELELDKRVTGSSKDKRSDDKRHMDHNTSRSAERHAGDDRSTSASASCSTKNEYGHTQEGLKDEELEEFLHSRKKRGRGAIGPRMDETGPYLPPNPDEEPSTSPDFREHRAIYGPKRPPSLQSYESSKEILEGKWKKRQSYESSEEELHEKKRKMRQSYESSEEELHEKKRKKRQSYESSEDGLHEEKRKKRQSYESSEDELHEEKRKKSKKSHHKSHSDKVHSKKHRSKEKSKHKKRRREEKTSKHRR
ncbi:hypothetical protein MtrunA17_Chr2g0280241 [Medicago truncatula]|nr:hypothetical protein MtrunA17_Chr2g0280241 [Medicago truncatula]